MIPGEGTTLGATPANLPDLRNAILTELQWEILLADIQICTRVVEVMVKPTPGRIPTGAVNIPVFRVSELLKSREVRGVQIRYELNGATWFDTLMVSTQGLRLVRVQL